MNRILILGGSYFIGRTLLKKIDTMYEKEDVQIEVLNRGTKTDVISKGNIQLVADRNNLQEIEKVLKGKQYDYIFDISGTTKQQVENVVNSIGVENIGVYVFLSSSAVYQDGSIPPVNECDKIGKNSIWGKYGLDKVECEDYLRNKSQKEGLKYILIRPPYVYGDWNYIYRESYCFERAENNRPIIVPGDGSQKIQFIHVDDLCDTIIKLANTPESYNDVYNVGNEILTFEEWVKACIAASQKNIEVKKCVDYKEMGFKSREFFPFYDYDNYLNTEKVNKYFKPKVSIEYGLLSAYKWYKNNKQYIDRRNYESVENIIMERI